MFRASYFYNENPNSGASTHASHSDASLVTDLITFAHRITFFSLHFQAKRLPNRSWNSLVY